MASLTVVYSYEKTLLVPLPDVHRKAAIDAVTAANWTNQNNATESKRLLDGPAAVSVIVDVYSDGTRRIRGAS